MICAYKIGDLVQYEAPNQTSSNHVTFKGYIASNAGHCLSCGKGSYAYEVETQYGPRTVCEAVLRKQQT